MGIVAGIDEAGLGPVVGPLVVSASVFRVPDDLLDQCLWRLLAGGVTRKRLRTSPALPVADSKDMYVRTDGVVHLERGLLGVLALGARPPDSMLQFLRRLAPAVLKQLQEYAWYAGRDLPLPRQADPTDVVLRANGLAEAMARRGVGFEGIRVEPVLEGQYNRLLAATRNKAEALFGVVGRLVAWVFQNYAMNTPTRILVDRIGGRTRYLPPLLRMFPGSAVKVLEESERRSAYAVRDGPRSAEIVFQVDADADLLPVALASMASKYTRELFMELLNDWWASRVENLKPTAGYRPDGVRFLRDIGAYVSDKGIDRSLLERAR